MSYLYFHGEILDNIHVDSILRNYFIRKYN